MNCVSVAEELLKKKTICYKNIEMSVSMYEQGSTQRDFVSDAAAAAAAAASDGSRHVLIKVSGIPPGMSEDVVRMIFENKRYGGGEIKTFEFCQSDNTAVIEFESSSGSFIR